MTERQRQLRGFTLVEILAVVVILGIASAVILPQVGTRDDLRARAAARHLMADLIYAQNRAIATQRTHYVLFNLTSQTYSVLSDIDTGTVIPHPITKTDYTVALAGGGGPLRVDSRLDTVQMDGAARTILAFDDLGVPQAYDPGRPAGQRLVPLSDRADVALRNGAFALTVHVSAYTGEVSVD